MIRAMCQCLAWQTTKQSSKQASNNSQLVTAPTGFVQQPPSLQANASALWLAALNRLGAPLALEGNGSEASWGLPLAHCLGGALSCRRRAAWDEWVETRRDARCEMGSAASHKRERQNWGAEGRAQQACFTNTKTACWRPAWKRPVSSLSLRRHKQRRYGCWLADGQDTASGRRAGAALRSLNGRCKTRNPL